MVNFEFKYKNKKFSIEAEECKTFFEKTKGLMFKKNSLPLLFYFGRLRRYTIHSFFCRPFVAVWFNKNEIVDVKKIISWKFSIKPKEKFNKLLEIPFNNKNYLLFSEFE